MYVAFPGDAEIGTRNWWHDSSQPIRVNWKNGREEQIAAHVKNQPGAGGFTLILYPKGRYEIEPEYKSNEDGTAVEVNIGHRRDVVFCSRDRKRTSFGDADLDGTVAVVKKTPDYTSLILLEPRELRAGDLAIVSDVPISIRLQDGALTGQALGPGDAAIHLPAGFAGKEILVDRKAVGVVAADNIARVSVGEGLRTVEILGIEQQ
jgi:hypothetical protein